MGDKYPDVEEKKLAVLERIAEALETLVEHFTLDDEEEEAEE